MGRHVDLSLRWLNLSLLALYPLAWGAPLLRAGLLPLFAMEEISVLSGLAALWSSDIPLALIVTFLALFAPYAKTLGLALVQFGWLDRRALPALTLLGKLAMVDVFLIAIYITVFKGLGIGRIEVAWGLYLFTACLLASLLIGLRLERVSRTETD